MSIASRNARQPPPLDHTARVLTTPVPTTPVPTTPVSTTPVPTTHVPTTRDLKSRDCEGAVAKTPNYAPHCATT